MNGPEHTPSILLNTIALEPRRWAPDKKPARPLPELLPAIRKAGFRGIEIWPYHLLALEFCQIQTLSEKMAALKLSAPVVGLYPQFHLHGDEAQEEMAQWKNIIAKARMLGTRWLKIFAGRLPAAEITAQDQTILAERLAILQEWAQTSGIGICIEIHAKTLFDPPEAGFAFFQQHPHLQLNICFQPFDFQDHHATIELARQCAGKIVHVHIQGRDANHSVCMPHEGNIDYSELLPLILSENPVSTLGIEFVPAGMVTNPDQLDLELALSQAAEVKRHLQRWLST